MADELDDDDLQEGYEEEIDSSDIDSVLSNYHKQQLLLHMIGPILSLVVHLVVLGSMSKFVVGETVNRRPPVEVEITELEVKELEEIVKKDLELTEPEDEPIDAPPVDEPAPDAPAETDVASMDVDSIADAPGETSSLEGLSFAESDVAEVVTPLKISGVFSNRSGAARGRSVSRYGGGRASENAVDKALQWLQSVQRPDGSWNGQSAHSGLALLVFLAHGETPLSEKYGRTVQMGMQWLANDMMRLKPGKLSGGRAYSHGIATYALAEAYGMTQIPFLRSAMDKGLDIIIRGQQAGGGFDYRYTKGDRWDLSVGGWQVQAMKAGKAAGANTPGLDKAIEKSITWLQKETYKNGKFGYSSPGSGSNMTGVGTVCLQLLGEAKSGEAKGGVETIATERYNQYVQFASGQRDFELEGHRYIYGWYYDTQAMFNAGGRLWKSWNKVFQKVLVRSQSTEGYWEFKDEKTHYGKGEAGRILVTSWCALQLEVYYRYLPTFDLNKMSKKADTSAAMDILEGSGLIIE